MVLCNSQRLQLWTNSSYHMRRSCGCGSLGLHWAARSTCLFVFQHRSASLFRFMAFPFQTVFYFLPVSAPASSSILCTCVWMGPLVGSWMLWHSSDRLHRELCSIDELMSSCVWEGGRGQRIKEVKRLFLFFLEKVCEFTSGQSWRSTWFTTLRACVVTAVRLYEKHLAVSLSFNKRAMIPLFLLYCFSHLWTVCCLCNRREYFYLLPLIAVFIS